MKNVQMTVEGHRLTITVDLSMDPMPLILLDNPLSAHSSAVINRRAEESCRAL